jgi:hypothetical protein
VGQFAKLSHSSAERLPSDVCSVTSHFLRLFARFPFTSFAIAAITSQKNADGGAQSHADSESDSEGAERALFDSILSVINQVFRRTAALFDGAFSSDDAIVDRASDGFLHAFDFGSYLITNFFGFFDYLGLHSYSLFD